MAVLGRIRLASDAPYPWLNARRQQLEREMKRADSKLKQCKDSVLNVKSALWLRQEALERLPEVGNAGDQRSRPARQEAVAEAETELLRVQGLLDGAEAERAAILARMEELEAEMFVA